MLRGCHLFRLSGVSESEIQQMGLIPGATNSSQTEAGPKQNTNRSKQFFSLPEKYHFLEEINR
jgi:hypothetical protein